MKGIFRKALFSLHCNCLQIQLQNKFCNPSTYDIKSEATSDQQGSATVLSLPPNNLRMPFCDWEIQDILEPVFSSTDLPTPPVMWMERLSPREGSWYIWVRVELESESRNSGPWWPSQCSPSLSTTVTRACRPRHRIWLGERIKSRLHSPTGPCMTCPAVHPTSLTQGPPFSHSQPTPKTLTSLQAHRAFLLVGPSVWNVLPGILTLVPVLPSGRGGKVTLYTRSPWAPRKSGHALCPHGATLSSPCLAFSSPLACCASACCGLHCRLPRAQNGAAHTRSVLNI